MLKSAWVALSLSIKNIINEAGFGTFFEALLNQETHEYKDLQLLFALAKALLVHYMYLPFSKHWGGNVETL